MLNGFSGGGYATPTPTATTSSNFTDSFTSDSLLYAKSDTINGTGTATITGGKLNVISSGGLAKSGMYNYSTLAKNAIITADCTQSSNDFAEIRLCDNTYQDYLAMKIGQNGSSAAIYNPNINAGANLFTNGMLNLISGTTDSVIDGNVYKMTLKHFNDGVFSLVQKSNGDGTYTVKKSNMLVNSSFDTMTGRKASFGASHSSRASVYDNLEFKELKSGFLNIVGLGASNVEGSSIPVDICQNFCNLLSQQYYNKPVHILNKGVGGNTIAQLAARLSTDLYANKVTGATNIALIQIGNNTISAGANTEAVGIAAFKDLINTVIQPIKDNGWQVWVMTDFPTEVPVSHNIAKQKYNDLIREGVLFDKVIDTWDLFINPTDSAKVLQQYYRDEGVNGFIHWNIAGHTLVTNTVKTYIDNYLNRGV